MLHPMMQQMYSVGMPQDRTVLKTNRTSVNFCRTLLRSGSNPQACADLLPRNQPFRLPNIRLDWQQRRTLLRMEPDLNITFRANQQSGMLSLQFPAPNQTVFRIHNLSGFYKVQFFQNSR